MHKRNTCDIKTMRSLRLWSTCDLDYRVVKKFNAITLISQLFNFIALDIDLKLFNFIALDVDLNWS